jgi:hypothetical protein
VTHDGRAATLDLERQLVTLERSSAGGLNWAWLLVVLGLVLTVALAAHAATAYATIARIDVPAQIRTANPVLLFQEVATNGPRVGNTVENSSRSTYTKALEQFVLDGTGVTLGIALLTSGLFVRLNRGKTQPGR